MVQLVFIIFMKSLFRDWSADSLKYLNIDLPIAKQGKVTQANILIYLQGKSTNSNKEGTSLVI